MYVTKYDAICFESFGIEHIPKEIKLFIGNKKMKTNVFRIQVKNSIICRSFCIEFINNKFAGKTLIDNNGNFSPYDFKKNDQILLGYIKMDNASYMYPNLSTET